MCISYDMLTSHSRIRACDDHGTHIVIFQGFRLVKRPMAAYTRMDTSYRHGFKDCSHAPTSPILDTQTMRLVFPIC